jgi:5'-3' exoribonuclease 2
MGVPAFFRWLTEKYPKVLEDVVEERVKLAGGEGTVRVPFDSTRPNPSGLECDNLYIDMNGIIHPCSHPEHGPQPKTEEEMYENVCHYVDRLFRIMRPRKLLYLAIDGVAPRAKMNQQRSRRFRSAQEARENLEVEQNIRNELTKNGQRVPPAAKAWDSNVITPGTPFMLKLAEFIRFYVRKRISTDKAWQNIRVIFSDASIPGEGEHKIMSHIRLQRSQPGYNPNLVHVLHGLDADLVMLALATHEAHFYISREEVMFGRKSQEMAERRQTENGYREQQRLFDEEAGDMAMQLLENKQKPICRVSIPILREYLAADFAQCIDPGRITFAPSLERLIDDIIFLCFFVGNGTSKRSSARLNYLYGSAYPVILCGIHFLAISLTIFRLHFSFFCRVDFLPHLPSLDIRDGALDYLFNVYKRILPSLGDYITNHGGQVNLSHVDVILAEVGSIEDYVFNMKHENEEREKVRREQFKARNKRANGRSLDDPRTAIKEVPKVQGRAARILEKQKTDIALKKEVKGKIKSSHMKSKDNLQAAAALKKSLEEKVEGEVDEKGENNEEDHGVTSNQTGTDVQEKDGDTSISTVSPKKRKFDEVEEESGKEKEATNGVGVVGDIEEEFDQDEEDDSPEVVSAFKERVKNDQRKKLDEYAKNVEDKVRLHEKGWKDRYYSDKCKADDVANHGGREHLFRSYVIGLCWVMKYYYEGCKFIFFVLVCVGEILINDFI